MQKQDFEKGCPYFGKCSYFKNMLKESETKKSSFLDIGMDPKRYEKNWCRGKNYIYCNEYSNKERWKILRSGCFFD